MHMNIFFIFRGEDENSSCVHLGSDEEDLERPLPLRSDDELRHYNPFIPPYQHMHNFSKDISIVYNQV